MFLSEAHEQVRETARKFADEVIRPLAEELDRDERFPAEIYDQMAELGLFGICVPEELGGPGFDTLTYALVMEELSRGYASIADQCGLVELICTLLVRHGTEGQQARWIGDVLSVKARVAYCITEPEAGTDVSGIQTSAVRDGDGWALNGGKIWIHNAPVADVGFVLARTDKNAGHRGSPSRRGGPRIPHDDERARHGAGRNRRIGGRYCPGRARSGRGLCSEAQAVSETDR
jgi:alkylation response protein AidB-like acyl-CoA dehydrogenase